MVAQQATDEMINLSYITCHLTQNLQTLCLVAFSNFIVFHITDPQYVIPIVGKFPRLLLLLLLLIITTIMVMVIMSQLLDAALEHEFTHFLVYCLVLHETSNWNRYASWKLYKRGIIGSEFPVHFTS